MITEIDLSLSYLVGDYYVRVTAIMASGRGKTVIYHHTGQYLKSRRMPLQKFLKQAVRGEMYSADEILHGKRTGTVDRAPETCGVQ